MGGKGSGRRPKVPNGANGSNGASSGAIATGLTPRFGTTGPRVTFGQMFASVPASSAPVAAPDARITTGTPPAAPAPALPTPPGGERPENRSFAHLVGYVSANIGVAVIGDHLRKKGFEPHEPSSEDVDRTSEATADAIVVALGDMAVPWWGAICAAWGNLYLSMRVGAKRIEQQAPATTTTPASTTTTPLGLVVPERRPASAPPRPGGPLPPVEVTSS